MKRKYFFFDIDGTLGLKLTKQLPADTAYCLKRLVQKGHFATHSRQGRFARI